ncbi:methylglyoxal synthase [Gottschalkia purinilytica]|uniref:Methylglyoxal synthase n=1 Tax=Gottschalkia purinilytica TaxID=1503 RepID=A0A0L0WDA4_GOTPU|nr:methylglyoxal synthase [Gottschalkia purinilytica]KNF09447.1 methylglyoxal synthase [Gottschalkia purinilytica]
MNIALIAHDKKKKQIVNFTLAYEDILKNHSIYATGTTGKHIEEATGLKINKVMSGPVGGDQQIGAMIANNEMDLIIFLRDPLTVQPHEPDVQALIRLSDVHNIPIATNLGTAELIIKCLERGDIDWREVIKETKKDN